jgi:heterodisulfide reductase subunit D
MFKKIMDKLLGMVRNTLYYPGCLTKYALPEILANYEKVLKKMDIDFIMLKEQEFCCGSPVIRAGYRKEFKQLKKENIELFKQYGVSRIITSCPACYHMLKTEYGFEVEHMTQTVWKNINRFDKDKFKGEKITYHDPCHLGRYSDIYEEPRKILEYLGFEVVELKDNHEKSMCCGGGGGIRSYDIEAAKKIAKLRLGQLKTKKIITPCPMCYSQLKENAKDIEVLEFSEVLV